MSQNDSPSPGKVIAMLGLFVILGIPFVAYLWETLHHVLSLHIEPMRLLVSVVLLAIFGGLLAVYARWLGRQFPR